MHTTIEFLGERFWFNGKDYFRNARGQLLHRVMWTKLRGPIPAGYVVHHINGDKLDNRIENFEIMLRGDHVRHHGPRGWALFTAEYRSSKAKREWANRQPTERFCKLCGTPYLSRATYSAWCSIKCQVAARYRNQQVGIDGSER